MQISEVRSVRHQAPDIDIVPAGYTVGKRFFAAKSAMRCRSMPNTGVVSTTRAKILRRYLQECPV